MIRPPTDYKTLEEWAYSSFYRYQAWWDAKTSGYYHEDFQSQKYRDQMEQIGLLIAETLGETDV